jgi:hypothetical protein
MMSKTGLRRKFERDQVAAATSQLRSALAAESALLGLETRSGEGMPRAVAWLVSDLYVAARAGRVEYCVHVSDAAPQPAACVVWENWRRIHCFRCWPTEDPRGDERWRCDFCGEVKIGDCAAVKYQGGPLLVVMGLCSDCGEDCVR